MPAAIIVANNPERNIGVPSLAVMIFGPLTSEPRHRGPRASHDAVSGNMQKAPRGVSNQDVQETRSGFRSRSKLACRRNKFLQSCALKLVTTWTTLRKRRGSGR